jgi:hypothetical protein
MYDLFTSTVLFFILAPGVVVTLPPGVSGYISALVHAAVFFVVQTYLPNYVPAWGIWIIGAVILMGRVYWSTRTPSGVLGMGTEMLGGRRR